MSPIKGLSEQRRLPRVGKIHLGVKKQNSKGVEYPSATDYFVCPPEIQAVYGDEPKELNVMIPVEDEEYWASQYYRAYSRTRGLICKGDGVECNRMVDTKTGDMANRDSKEVVWKPANCEGRECPYYQNKQCREVMNLQFLLPDIQGIGVWQIDTSSVNSIRNINSAMELIRGICGHIRMLPLLLTLEKQEVVNPDDGKKKNVSVLNLRLRQSLHNLLADSVKPVQELLAPPPAEDEAPRDEPEIIVEVKPDTEHTEKDAKELYSPDPPHAAEAAKAAEEAFVERQAKTDAPQSTPAPVAEESNGNLPEPAGGIDMDWLKESAKSIKWTEKTLTTWIAAKFKVKGGLLEDVVAELSPEQRKDVVKEIQDRVDMA